jgi:hypothetical protein
MTYYNESERLLTLKCIHITTFKSFFRLIDKKKYYCLKINSEIV